MGNVPHPYFTYAIEWMKVDSELQVVGSHDQGRSGNAAKSDVLNRFGTESYSVRLHKKTFVYKNVLGGNKPVFVENVGDLTDVAHTRKQLARKHGIISCLFIPCGDDCVIEIGSIHRLRLLDGVSASDVVLAIKEG